MSEWAASVLRPATLPTPARLAAGVLAAYGWPAGLPAAAILERLLALNAARASGQWSVVSDE